MVQSTIIRTSSGLKFETFERFSSIPLVETGLHTGYRIYNRVKRSNRLMTWGLETSENVALSIMESMRPAVRFVEGPLQTIDKLGLKVLEQVEDKIPNLYLPPQMIYWNTKEYVSDHVVRPVLKRADSFGDIVDGAIEKADHALDKYLPDTDSETREKREVGDSSEDCKNRTHAYKTLRRSKKLSKKLKNKLASRTVAEVNAIKNDVHILIYAAELIATNPKEAYKKAKELWSYFSKNEPENQKRPETLEELFVLLIREAARKLVHLVNFVFKHASKIPRKIKSATQEFLHSVLYLTDSILQMVKLKQVQLMLSKVTATYDEVSKQTNIALERLAIFFSGRLEAEKIQSNISRIYTRPTSINGLY